MCLNAVLNINYNSELNRITSCHWKISNFLRISADLCTLSLFPRFTLHASPHRARLFCPSSSHLVVLAVYAI